MSYTIDQAVGRRHDTPQRLTTIDNPGSQTYRDLTQTYRDVQLQIDHTDLNGPFIIDLEDLTTQIDIHETLNTFFSSVADEDLPSKVSGSLTISTNRATYADAFAVGFHIEPGKIASHPTVRWPESVYKDLLLSVPDGTLEDYEHLHETAIVHVNGFAHRTSASEHGLYVVDGNKSYTIANETEVSITDLSAIGKLEQVPLESSMIERAHSEQLLNQHCYLDVGQDLENKTILVSIGGYLHILDEMYECIGGSILKINFARYPHIQRYFESKQYIDMGSISYTPMDKNDEQRLVSDFLDNEDYIKQLLDLEQTFLIVVDQAPMFVNTYPLQQSHIVGNYYAYELPKWPLVIQRGRFRCYRFHQVYDHYVVNLADDFLPQYQFETMPLEELHSVTPQKLPTQPYQRDRGVLLEIGIDRLT